VERYAEDAASSDTWAGADVLELWPGRHGISVPGAGDCTHTLLDKGPVRGSGT